jgi:NAD(P)-dependent dehydrogenase (short-subunit alcohol dehydrogenase family)
MQRVLITGAASGLGRALALAWAKRGARVLIADLNAERGAESLALCRDAGAADAQFILLDVRKAEDFEAAVAWLQQHWGGLDVMVNNAGVAGGGRFDSISEADWQWMLDINLMGVVRGCKVFTPVFKNQGHGYFVNVASMAGFLDVPLMSAYNASKAGVVSLSETLQLELRGDNIGVSVICPSFLKTNLTQTMRTTDPALRKTVNKLFEMGKISAEHIADDIFRAVEKKRFYVLPHPEGRFILFLKRILPRAVYAWLIDRSTRRMRSRADSES